MAQTDEIMCERWGTCHHPVELCSGCAQLPLVAQATKAELYEIAGAFAKLASTPNGPGATEVYEEVEKTLGNVT